jgi:hypothetical protein
MSHALNIHDGLGNIARDPAIGILMAYGSTVPPNGRPGYAPGCLFIKTNGTSASTVEFVNLGTKASAAFVSSGLQSTSPSIGLGYATGAGGAVVQASSRTTGVTLNTICGQITTNTTSLAAEAAAAFTVTNSSVAVGDVVVACIRSGSNGGMTAVQVSTVAAGSFALNVMNNNVAAGTAETGAIIINFVIIKAVSA